MLDNNITYLLLTKNYPPQFWGMEKYSFDLYQNLKKQGKVYIIYASPRNIFLNGKKHKNIFWKIIYLLSEFTRLSFFFIESMTKGIILGFFSDEIWSLDGSIWFLSYFIGKIVWKKTKVTLHGTDVIWPNCIYQTVLPFFWKRIDSVVAISLNTKIEACKRWVSGPKINLLEHKINDFSYLTPEPFDKNSFLQKLGINYSPQSLIVFSIGRWIPRKGFHWFLKDVMPFLNKNFIYILAWSWWMKQEYLNIIDSNKINNVILLDSIDDEKKAKLFLVSDYFLMPNIKIDNDMEWFGLVLLEAQFYSLKTIVSDVDGLGGRVLDDAIVLPYQNSSVWIQRLNYLYSEKYENDK